MSAKNCENWLIIDKIMPIIERLEFLLYTVYINFIQTLHLALPQGYEACAWVDGVTPKA